MGISVGTIFKWLDSDNPDDSAESCLDGQCVGKVTEIIENPDNTDKPSVSVKWWEMCKLHHEIDPNGTGPYDLSYIWQIGQLY